MIRLIREGSAKYPWILIGIIFTIALAFIVTMGWDGFGSSQSNTVAEVGPYKVTKQEYLRAKQRYYQFYRDQLKQEDIKDETLQQLAIDSLVTNKSWQGWAEEFARVGAPKELQ